MKKYIICIVYMFLFVTIKVQAQDFIIEGGRINMYVIPFNIEIHGFKQLDINYIRAQAVYKVTTTENYTIKQFRETLFNDTNDSIVPTKRNLIPRILVDFVWNERVIESVVFDKDGFYERDYLCSPNTRIKLFIEQFFPPWVVKFEE